MFIGHKCTQKNQEIKIKTKEIALITANLTEIRVNLRFYFLKIAEISIKRHKMSSYFLALLADRYQSHVMAFCIIARNSL